MALTPAICPNCKGILEVNPEQDAANCKYCGTPFIIEKAIHQYNINNITIVNGKKQNDIINDGLAQIDLNMYSDSYETFKSFTKNYPRDWRGWFGLAVADYALDNTEGFTLSDDCWSMCPSELQGIKGKVGKLEKLNAELIAEEDKDYNTSRERELFMQSYPYGDYNNQLRMVEANLEENLKNQKETRAFLLIFTIILLPLTIWGFLMFGNGHPIKGGLMIFMFGSSLIMTLGVSLFTDKGLIKGSFAEAEYKANIEKYQKIIDEENRIKKEFEEKKSERIREIKDQIKDMITFQLAGIPNSLNDTKYFSIDRTARTIMYISILSYYFSCFVVMVRYKENTDSGKNNTNESMKGEKNNNCLNLFYNISGEDLLSVLGINKDI